MLALLEISSRFRIVIRSLIHVLCRKKIISLAIQNSSLFWIRSWQCFPYSLPVSVFGFIWVRPFSEGIVSITTFIFPSLLLKIFDRAFKLLCLLVLVIAFNFFSGPKHPADSCRTRTFPSFFPTIWLMRKLFSSKFLVYW